MYTLLNNTASDFANSTPVDRIGFVQPADLINCLIADDYAEYIAAQAEAEAAATEENLIGFPV